MLGVATSLENSTTAFSLRVPRPLPGGERWGEEAPAGAEQLRHSRLHQSPCSEHMAGLGA